MNMLQMTPEQYAAHQERVKGARTIRFEANETDQEIAQKGRQPKGKAKAKPAHHKPESVVLRECEELLDCHPKIAFWWRQNTFAMKDSRGVYVRSAFVGCSDLLACSTSGKFIAIECKSTGKKPTDDQRAFIENVRKAGGLAVCVDHPGMLALALEEL